ncbi:PREDICTED: uncharacterized protein LOC108357814 [Rhagoletis zephyria]|nr:PREDICTED: uncharacterized protein LOC108357814 [Rhagoletis zephyria]
MEEKLVNVICAVLCTPIEDWTELSWEESMSPGIDMLYHYGPLNRVKNNEGINAIETNVTHANFDYSRFRRHMLSIFERIQRVAATTELTAEELTAAKADEPKLEKEREVDISGLSELLEVMPSEQRSNFAKSRLVRRSTLEAVEDDDEEECDEDDLRKVGYRKEYGSQQNKTGENSEWVNENYELPTSEELFSDLGIWW